MPIKFHNMPGIRSKKLSRKRRLEHKYAFVLTNKLTYKSRHQVARMCTHLVFIKRSKNRKCSKKSRKKKSLTSTKTWRVSRFWSSAWRRRAASLHVERAVSSRVRSASTSTPVRSARMVSANLFIQAIEFRDGGPLDQWW